MDGWFGKAKGYIEKAATLTETLTAALSLAAKTPLDAVELSQKQLVACTRVDGALPFGLVQERDATLHVLFQTRTGTSYSLFRSKSSPEAAAKLAHFRMQAPLFSTIEADKALVVEATRQVHAHPHWQTFHYAAALGVLPYFHAVVQNDPASLSEQLSVASAPEGSNPLQLACAAGQAAVVAFFTDFGADPTRLDPNGCNAVHFAATAADDSCITVLAAHASFGRCVDALCGAGLTPLFVAMRNRRAAAVAALLGCGADPLLACLGHSPLHEATRLGSDAASLTTLAAFVRGAPTALSAVDNHTNTILHFSHEKKVLATMLDSLPDADLINAKNVRGETALIAAVMAGRTLGCVLCLLSHGATTDAADLNGMTSLHHAAKSGRGEMAKALLLFGAPPSSTDLIAGMTPSHYAAQLSQGSSRTELTGILAAFSDEPTDRGGPQNCLDEFAQTLALTTRMSERLNDGVKQINLLALDGGGIRGLVLIQVLLHLEAKLGRPIFPLFEWVGGTSTGGILAIALGLGRSLRQCQSLYFRFKDAVFCGSRPYDTAVLETFLKNEVSVDRCMDCITGRRLFVTTVEAHEQPVALKLLRNYQLPVSDSENAALGYVDPKTVSLWRAARSTSAAPTFFESVDAGGGRKLVDGGLVANNPTLELLADVHALNTALAYAGGERLRVGCVLSVGTGSAPPKAMSAVDVSLPTGVVDAVTQLVAAANLKNILIDQVTATDGRPVERSRAWCHSLGLPYFRFSPPLPADIDLDETDDAALVRMLWHTELYLRGDCAASVQALVQFLSVTRDH